MPPNRIDLLRRAVIFGNFTDDELAKIADLMEERHCSENEHLFHRGDAGNSLLLILEGRVKVYLPGEQGETILAYFNPGDVLGEMALLTGDPRSASAIALTDTVVLELAKEAFSAHLATNAGAMREMVRIMALRQFQMSQRLTRSAERAAEADIGGGRVYVVYSPRGGAGKTTIAVNLAVSLALKHPGKVGLLDLALTFSHCALALNLSPKATLAKMEGDFLATMEPEELKSFIIDHPSSLKIIVAAGIPEEGEAVTSEIVRVAIQGMRRLFPITVVDTDSTFSEPTIAALDAADRVLVLCAPELGTVKDIRECQRVFADVIGLPKDKLLYVLNRTVPFSSLTRDQFSEAVLRKMWAEIPFGNDLPANASARGEAVTQLYPQADMSKALDRMAEALEGGGGRDGVLQSAPTSSVALRQHGTFGDRLRWMNPFAKSRSR